MQVKIDTKEKFHAITIKEPVLSANMTAELDKVLTDFQNTSPHNIVLNLEQVEQLDETAAQMLVQAQARSYEASRSFVICQLQAAVEKQLDEWTLLELLNVTPTMSEAWDIIQMEEIERELLDGLEE